MAKGRVPTKQRKMEKPSRSTAALSRKRRAAGQFAESQKEEVVKPEDEEKKELVVIPGVLESESEDGLSTDASSDTDDEAVEAAAGSSSRRVDEHDSSDEEDLRNTIGNVPVEWYDDCEHVGYDWDGAPIGRPSARRSEIDEFLSKMDDPDYWRRVRDRQTGAEVALSDEQVGIIANIQGGRYPSVGYNPYQPFIDFFTHEVRIHPLSNRPEHKRSFIPSLLEKKKVGKLVHAIKMGWLKPRKPKPTEEQLERSRFYDLWAADSGLTSNQRNLIKMRLPAPKMPLPDHAESYNPPPEYLLTPEEEEAWKAQESYERRRDFVPHKFDSLRHVPAYPRFINERFDRCLDLYLAPRQRKMRLNVNPDDLLPQLPSPQDLRPFPSAVALVLRGHSAAVRAVAVEPLVGQFAASADDDGGVRVWELLTARCVASLQVGGAVSCLAWCPDARSSVLLVVALVDAPHDLQTVGSAGVVECCSSITASATRSSFVELPTPSTPSSRTIRLRTVHSPLPSHLEQISSDEPTSSLAKWSRSSRSEGDFEGLLLKLEFEKEVRNACWHHKGDYFATVSPTSGKTSVIVHQLSKMKSQAPFARPRGLVQCVLFHPSRPLFFLATQKHVRIYDLAKQQLVKKLYANCQNISSICVHPKGDNLIVGSYDSKLSWFDLDLSNKPYKTLKHHKSAIQSVAFHSRLPLFASASDDGSVIVCHGRVYSDLMKNALIVPVKVLRGHKQTDGLNVLSCAFHPTQPWILTGGADATLRLYTY